MDLHPHLSHFRARTYTAWAALLLVTAGCDGSLNDQVIVVGTPATTDATALGAQAPQGSTAPGSLAIGPHRVLPLCLPVATPWEPGSLQDQPGAFDKACGLQSVQVDADGNGKPDSLNQYQRSGDTVTVTHRGATGTVLTTQLYTLDSKDQVVGLQHFDQSGALQFQDTRSWDKAGHLLVHETQSSGGYGSQITYTTRIAQKWQAGLLIERRQTTTPGENSATWTWTYDSQGRMRTASVQVPKAAVAIASATWHYDSQGRPIQVIRHVGGKVWLNQLWVWGAGSQLLARTALVFPSNSGGGDKLDSYDTPTGSVGSGGCYGCGYGGYGAGNGASPWADALPAPTSDCQPIATAVGHGYPEADYAPAGDYPVIGHNQNGYNAYGYGYYGYYGYGGNPGFVGHGGMGANWDALAVSVPHLSAQFEISYDRAGRMTSEALQVEPTNPKSTAPRQLLRQRTFVGKHLAADQVMQGKAVLRALTFDRDSAGRMQRRELQVFGQVAQQDVWDRDQQGRPLQWTRMGQQNDNNKVFLPAVPSTVVVPGPLQMQRNQCSYGENGLPDTELVAVGKGQPVVLFRTLGYDKRGRLVAESSGGPSLGTEIVQAWQFDDAGRETLHQITYPQGNAGSYTKHKYAADGLLLQLEQGTTGSKSVWLQKLDYACH